MKKDNIKIKDHVGTWYVIDEKPHPVHKKVYLLEHEQYGDLAACLIVDGNFNLLKANVYDGLDELND